MFPVPSIGLAELVILAGIAGLVMLIVAIIVVPGGFSLLPLNPDNTFAILAFVMGTGYGRIDDNIRQVFLQLALPLRLAPSFHWLPCKSQKNSSTENQAQQISKGSVHQILRSHILSYHCRLSIVGCDSANRPA